MKKINFNKKSFGIDWDSVNIVQALDLKKNHGEARNKADGTGILHVAAVFVKEPEIMNALIGERENTSFADTDKVCPVLEKKVNIRNTNGETPLHLAAAYNKNPEIAKALIEKGANVNAKQENSNTPLHYAIFEHSQDLVKLLLKHGADVSIRNRANYTALALGSSDSSFRGSDAYWLLLDESYKSGIMPRE